jgi:NADH dehydrogenase
VQHRIPSDAMTADLQATVVILGAGFGGLACAQALGRAQVDTLVIDRRNHNLFQPLLYQVATAALSPADIAEPIRKTLGRYPSVRVLMGEACAIANHRVTLTDGRTVSFDRLVIATGSDYSYFGHDNWRAHAPGLKSLREARAIRQRLLLSFERAEATDDPATRQALLTTAIIGGGPTGVEMAGAVADLGRQMVRRDFRTLSEKDVRVLLIEATPRILAGFPVPLAEYAARRLRQMGVDLLLENQVTDIGDGYIALGDRTIPVGCIVWAAGVRPSPAAHWLGLQDQARGRVPVDPTLAVTGRPDIFALGDTAAMDPPLPGLAQVAKQQGRWLGHRLAADLAGHTPPREGFRYRNRGNTAVIGRNAAVFDFGSWQLKGWLAWYLWALVHVALLVNFEKKILVAIQWTTRYVTRQRGARLIDEPPRE